MEEFFVLGDNTFSQLGTDDRDKVTSPQRVQSLSDLFAVAGGCCAFTTVIQTDKNEVFFVGNSLTAQFDTQSRPKQLPTFKLNVKEIACGYDDVIIISEERDAFMWPQPRQLLPGKKIAQVALASYHFGLVTEDGECFTWGQNNLGQLGHGDYVDRPDPVQLACFHDTKVVKFSCGSDFHSGGHSAVLTVNSELFVFGRVASSMDVWAVPTLLKEFSGMTVLSITCGENFNAAIVAPSKW